MNIRQNKFVDEYLATGNGAEAARRAGYSKKCAHAVADTLLQRDDVLTAIHTRLDEIRSEKIATTREILEHLTSILRGEETEVIVMPGNKKFTVPARISDRLQAASHLLRVAGAFRDRVDVKTDGAQVFLQTLSKISAE